MSEELARAAAAAVCPVQAAAMPKAPIPSPCNSVCRMNAVTGWCEGCRRTIDEIAAWSLLDDAGKQAVLERLAARKP